jgi:hypothetical protein
VIVTLDAGVVQDAGGNLNEAATATGNYLTPLTVTINKESRQADPTKQSPIYFLVVFSRPVTGDVRKALKDMLTLGGTAGATTAEVVTSWGTTTHYAVAVSGMTDPGTVIATLSAGLIKDAFDIPNEASTSDDNIVTYAP